MHGPTGRKQHSSDLVGGAVPVKRHIGSARILQKLPEEAPGGAVQLVVLLDDDEGFRVGADVLQQRCPQQRMLLRPLTPEVVHPIQHLQNLSGLLVSIQGYRLHGMPSAVQSPVEKSAGLRSMNQAHPVLGAAH